MALEKQPIAEIDFLQKRDLRGEFVFLKGRAKTQRNWGGNKQEKILPGVNFITTSFITASGKTRIGFTERGESLCR